MQERIASLETDIFDLTLSVGNNTKSDTRQQSREDENDDENDDDEEDVDVDVVVGSEKEAETSPPQVSDEDPVVEPPPTPGPLSAREAQESVEDMKKPLSVVQEADDDDEAPPLLVKDRGRKRTQR